MNKELRLCILRHIREQFAAGYEIYICWALERVGSRHEVLGLGIDPSEVLVETELIKEQVLDGLDGLTTLGFWVICELGLANLQQHEMPEPYRGLWIDGTPMRLAWIDRMIEDLS